MKARMLTVFASVLGMFLGGGCKDESPKSTNSPPVLDTIGAQTVAADTVLEVPLSASDPDQGQMLVFCKASGPAWAVVSGQGQSPGPVTGTLTLSPGPTDEGQHQVVVTVIDGGTCENPAGAQAEETVEVTVQAANLPPVLDPPGLQVVAAGSVLDAALAASDPDQGQTLVFCMASGPAWAAVSGQGPSPGPVTGTLTLSPGPTDEGQHQVVVRVIDGGTCANPSGAQAEETVTVNVLMCAADDPPVDLQVDLPADEGAHQEELEWWYWTGHMQAADGRRFGFELVFFLSGVGFWSQVAHHAITDISDSSFHFVSTGFISGRPEEVEGGYRFNLGSLTAEGGQGWDVLHAEVDNYILDVELFSRKSPVYQHENGYTDYSFGGNTYYFSRERMTLAGTLNIGGEEVTVTGTAWFDHQWGELGTAISTGWDWFALQLEDQREIMIFLVRDQGADVLVGGSYTDADCNTVELGPGEVDATPLGQWVSPHTGYTYPMGWDLRVRNMHFSVIPVLEDQELHGVMPMTYWEGACTVTGDATGRAYVELTGYQ